MVEEDVLKQIQLVLQSGFVNEGQQVTEFKEALIAYLGVENLLLTNSCTSALTLAYVLSGVRDGDEVITSPMTCVASNTPINNLGGKIVWADILPNTGGIDPLDVERKITQKTKAISFVNWAGTPSNLEALKHIGNKYNIPLIQDGAHSFGAKWNNKPISDYADFTCFSFQAIKHLSTGDGGALICKNQDKFKLANKLKWFGYDRDAVKDSKGEWKGQRWQADIKKNEVGYKFNMNNITASIGLSQMPYISEILNSHRRNAEIYSELLSSSKFIELTNIPTKALSSYWVYTCFVNSSEEKRDLIIELLNKEGIAAGLVHIPNDNYSAFSDFKVDLPGTRSFSSRQISIPCGWWLSPEDCKEIAKRILTICSNILG